jgi:hypothetical protein
MNKMVGFLLTCIMVMTLVGCGGNSNEHEGEAKTPSGSSIQKGSDYKEVVEVFNSKGFNNIKTEKLEDLITGWLTKDGEVESVSVDGDEDYSPGVWYSNDVEVIITYHTFSSDYKKTDSSSSNITNKENPKKENNSEATKVEKPKVEKTELEVLTVENSKDLAYILNTKDESDSLIKEFAQKYAGRTIEFDGNTAYVSNHGNYKTRFDYLIYAGDYSETTFSGPNFQFRDVNYYDLHLTGDNVPDTFGVGLNIRITATVEEYNENSGLFQLEPISIKMR